MDNLEQYKKIFAEVFSVNETELNDDFNKQNVENWDSVRQLSLVSALEDSFDIMMDTEDILEMTSYINGRQILAKYNINL